MNNSHIQFAFGVRRSAKLPRPAELMEEQFRLAWAMGLHGWSSPAAQIEYRQSESVRTS